MFRNQILAEHLLHCLEREIHRRTYAFLELDWNAETGNAVRPVAKRMAAMDTTVLASACLLVLGALKISIKMGN